MSRILFIFILLTLALDTIPAHSQDREQNELSLRLSRDFGYALAGQMQGTFSYRVSGPESLSRVEFMLDDAVIGQDTSAPFRFQIDTGDYSNGSHKLKAIGYTADGQTLASEAVTRQFVSGSAVKWLVIVVVALFVVGRL